MCNKVTNLIFCMYRLGKQLNENSSLFVEIHIKSLQNATHPHMLRISSLIANDSQTDTYRRSQNDTPVAACVPTGKLDPSSYACSLVSFRKRCGFS